jgi:hypothetical protein
MYLLQLALHNSILRSSKIDQKLTSPEKSDYNWVRSELNSALDQIQKVSQGPLNTVTGTFDGLLHIWQRPDSPERRQREGIRSGPELASSTGRPSARP